MNINLMGSDLMELRPCYITVMAWVGLIRPICNSQNTSNIEMGLGIDIDLKFSLKCRLSSKRSSCQTLHNV